MISIGSGFLSNFVAKEFVFNFVSLLTGFLYFLSFHLILQKYYYRFSRSRGKADYFEGRDDSGVVSARFVSEPGGSAEYQRFYSAPNAADETARARFLSYCMALGSATRPKTGQGTAWNDWWGRSGSTTKSAPAADRCRMLFTINTVGAGRGSTLLWETQPPLVHAEGPAVWTSEQETAATHLQRNFEEINHLCEMGLVAAHVQVLVCEPIAPQWTDWMDSLLPACGGKPLPPHQRKLGEAEPPASTVLKDRPSPVQIVVAATAATADTCHDLKSGFMEKRMQDLILAPPFLQDASNKNTLTDPHVKYTHPDLVSSEPHDVYVGLKWLSLVTMHAVSAFVQASADLAAATTVPASVTTDTMALSMMTPSSPFLIPSFVRVSYVSKENSKVAKWCMHGDFFHPAAWEICKDSFDTMWIPHSLASSSMSMAIASHCSSTGGNAEACGQWWVYMRELQMPTSPEVYANEVTPALVQGGSNFIYMLTERHHQEIVSSLVCRHENKVANTCPPLPQAVIPLGDLESFLINFTPNTALGKEHVPDRRPGYSKAAERQADCERVQKRKQLHDQEEIEHALFDYTIYPAALFHKDATLKAARARDAVLTPGPLSVAGPQTCHSSYYDLTITKPRTPSLGWCQMLARKGLCTLYADYVQSSAVCREACGMSLNWTPATPAAATS